MTSPTPNSWLCGAGQTYTRVSSLTKWHFDWPFMRLELGPETFVLRPVRVLSWMRKPLQIRYDAVEEADTYWSRTRLRLADANEGIIGIATPNEGVLRLADRLKAVGVPVRESKRSRLKPFRSRRK
jgi:hypothetical protein